MKAINGDFHGLEDGVNDDNSFPPSSSYESIPEEQGKDAQQFEKNIDEAGWCGPHQLLDCTRRGVCVGWVIICVLGVVGGVLVPLFFYRVFPALGASNDCPTDEKIWHYVNRNVIRGAVASGDWTEFDVAYSKCFKYRDYSRAVMVGNATHPNLHALEVAGDPLEAHVTLDTRVPIWSGTKWVAAMFVLDFVDQGLLNLTSRPCELVPALGPCDPADFRSNVTLAMLLTFTSGVNETPASPLCPESWSWLRCAASRWARTEQDKPFGGNWVAAPGSTWTYGPTHLSVAGLMALYSAYPPAALAADETQLMPLWNERFRAWQQRHNLFTIGALEFPPPHTGEQLAGNWGGLVLNANEYMSFLRAMAFPRNNATGLLSPKLLEQTLAPQFPSPASAGGLFNGMAFGHLVMCDDPQGFSERCREEDQHSASGMRGFAAGWDRPNGILSVQTLHTQFYEREKERAAVRFATAVPAAFAALLLFVLTTHYFPVYCGSVCATWIASVCSRCPCRSPAAAGGCCECCCSCCCIRDATPNLSIDFGSSKLATKQTEMHMPAAAGPEQVCVSPSSSTSPSNGESPYGSAAGYSPVDSFAPSSSPFFVPAAQQR